MAEEPSSSDDLRGTLLDYLDWYREIVVDRVRDLPEDQLRTSRLPSGWTPAGMLNHLANVERRWMRWGFMAEEVAGPWRDDAPDGAGWVTPELGFDQLREQLFAAGAHTRRIAEDHALDEHAAVSGRFPTAEEAPRLDWILLHLLQEYARHAGHLDIVRELHDGRTGESPRG